MLTIATASEVERSPLAVIAPNIDPLDLIEVRRGQVRRREFKPLGRLLRVMFERNDLGAPNALDPEEQWKQQQRLKQLTMLDWLKEGPLIGLSNDGQDYLVCSPMIHPPDLPDATWRQPIGIGADGKPKNIHHYENGIPIPHMPPKVSQRMRDRSRTICAGRDGEKWIVVQPVTQVLLQVPGGLGQIRYVSKESGTHFTDLNGRHAALLFDPHRQEGHLIFGRGEWDVLR